MIRIVHILTDSNIGGAGTYVATYLKNYNKNQFLPTIVIPKNSQVLNLLDGVDCEIIEADIVPDKSLDFSSIPVLRKIIKKGKYDIVHAHGSASARIAAKGLCKCVFTKHTLSESSGAVSKIIYGALGGKAIAVSKASADNLVQLGFNAKNIYTVLNGVDDMFVPSEQQKREAKLSFGIDADKFVVGCVARLHPVKDHKTLLDAAKKVLEKNNNVKFLFVGDGELKEELVEYTKTLGIESDCIFAGVIYDRPRVYHALDVYALASRHETFGLSMVESWSAKVATVVTAADGLVQVAQKDKTTLICDVGDSNALSDNLCKVCNDKTLADRLAQNGFELYKNKFSAKVFAENLEKVYIDIVK